MNIVSNIPMQCIHIDYISCKSNTVYLKLEVKLSLWIMLVTFSVVNMPSVFVFNWKLTFAKDDLTLNEYLISKNVSLNTVVEIKVGSSMNSLCSVELSCINDILISDHCIPGTYIFYNSWGKIFYLHLWSNNQLSCGILRKIFTMRAGWIWTND